MSIPFFTIEMNCQTQGSVFASMQRCAYGTACYYYGDDGDIDIGVGGKSWSSPGGNGVQRNQASTPRRGIIQSRDFENKNFCDFSTASPVLPRIEVLSHAKTRIL